MTAFVEPPIALSQLAGQPGRGSRPDVAGGDRARAGHHQAEHLAEYRHRGRGPHRVAGAPAAAQALLELLPVAIAEPPGPALVPEPPEGCPGAEPGAAEGDDRPGTGGHQDRGDVRADRSHERARDALVAVSEDDQPIQRVGPDHLLDLDGEQVAVQHRARLHQVFAKRDRRKLHASAAGRVDPCFDGADQVAQRQVARIQLACRVRDPDHRPRGVTADRHARAGQRDPVQHRDLVVA